MLEQCMGFSELGLVPEVLQALSECGYREPTPVQAQVIPVALTGCDVMAGAQTGTGKTAGFTLPLLCRLAPYATHSPSPARHPVRALILVPTRELAMQVEESVHKYGKHLPLRIAVVYGGIHMAPQIQRLREGVDILVATPGRLLDHVQNKTLDLSQVGIFVLDEADRMLDMGFMPDLRRIIELLPEERQNMMFSATFSGEIKKLADAIMRSPRLIEVAQRNTAAETVRQCVHPVERAQKHVLLTHLIRSRDLKQVLVFCGTKLGANRLTQHLTRSGIPANAIHGDKTQQARVDALEQFKRGEITVLVATDVAARGIDIDQLPTVINFDLPRVAEDYIHRIGRTGRAGALGEALSLVCDEELESLAAIEKLLNKPIPSEVVEGFLTVPVVRGPALRSKPASHREASVNTRQPDDLPYVSSLPMGQTVKLHPKPGEQMAALFLPPAKKTDITSG
jgi:ATP-dependent RNA helicase RhlE